MTSLSLQSFVSTASIGALAVSAGLPTAVSAEGLLAAGNGATSGYKLKAEGGLAVSDFSKNLFEDKAGAPLFDTDLGAYGSVAVSKAISENWDWRVSASVLSFGDNTWGISDADDSFTLSQSFSAATVDLDLGRKLKAGSADVRLGFGLIAGRVNQGFDSSFVGTTQADTKGFLTDLDFKGIGVKLSADGSTPVKAGSPFRLIGGASIAPMTGEFTVSGEGTGDKLGDGGSDSSDGKMMMSSAYLGVAYDFSDRAGMRFGLRADRFDGKVDGASGGGSTIFDGAVTTTTAFVGVDIQF